MANARFITLFDFARYRCDLVALQGAGLEFVPAVGKLLDGGPGLRTIPMPEPEVIAAEEAVELEEPVVQGPDAI